MESRQRPTDFNTRSGLPPTERLVGCPVCGRVGCTEHTELGRETENERSFETRIKPFMEEADPAELENPVSTRRTPLIEVAGLTNSVVREEVSFGDRLLSEEETDGVRRLTLFNPGKLSAPFEIFNASSTPDGRLVFVTDTPRWNIVMCKPDGSQGTRLEHERPQILFRSAALAPDGTIYAHELDGNTIVIDPSGETRQLMAEYEPGKQARITHAQPLPDGGFVGVYNKAFVRYKKEGHRFGDLHERYFERTDGVLRANVSPDGKVRLTIMRGAEANIYEIDTNNPGQRKRYVVRADEHAVFPQGIGSMTNGGFCIETSYGQVLRQDPDGTAYKMKHPDGFLTHPMSAPDGGLFAIQNGSALWFPPKRTRDHLTENPKQPPIARQF